MSLIRPGIDAQHLIKQAVNAKGLGTLARMDDAFENLRLNNMDYMLQLNALSRLQKKRKTDMLRSFEDEFLTKIGYLVHHKDDGSRIVEKYDSSWVQTKLKQLGSKMSEADLLQGVTKIKGDCDLRQTTVPDLSTLKKIGGTLRLDVTSPLKNLSGIEEIAGSVVVNVKNRADAKTFLQSLGINLEAIKGQIVPILKSYI